MDEIVDGRLGWQTTIDRDEHVVFEHEECFHDGPGPGDCRGWRAYSWVGDAGWPNVACGVLCPDAAPG
jgi:hypothetical protein